MPANKHRHIQEDLKLVIALELFVFAQKRVMVNSCGIEKGKGGKSQLLGNSNTSNRVLNAATPIFQVEVANLASCYSCPAGNIYVTYVGRKLATDPISTRSSLSSS